MYKQHPIVLLQSNQESYIHFIPKGEYENIENKLVPTKVRKLLLTDKKQSLVILQDIFCFRF